MVKLSLDNLSFPLSGYEYDDQTIVGFSHTHLEGTGGGAYGNILILPMIGDLSNILKGKCFSTFEHQNETATAGYYAVTLTDYDIRAELTASEHAGFHRYTLPRSSDAHILLDIGHSLDHRCINGYIKILNDAEIQGYGIYGYPVYFYAKFSRPFETCSTWKGCQLVRPFITIPESALVPPNAEKGQHGLRAEYFDNKILSGNA